MIEPVNSSRPQRPGPVADDIADEYARLRALHGPPECARRPAEFAIAERAVEVAASHGRQTTIDIYTDAAGNQTSIAAPIAAVQRWCHQCPLRSVCYDLMTTTTTGYTGIAGGVVLHDSQPYRPRRGRESTKKKRGVPTDPLQLSAADDPELRDWFSPSQLHELNRPRGYEAHG